MPNNMRNVIVPLTALLLAGATAAAGPHPDRGLYAVWTFGDTDVERLSYVRGGQITLDWQTVHPEPGRFDFASLDALLREMQARGRKATVQINGGRKPAWLFARVPHHPERVTPQVGDPRGSLMYWHPAHVSAHLDLLRAWAEHLRQSPYKSAVLGIRQNLNALGTEFTVVPEGKRSLAQWITPSGVAPGTEWTLAAATDYHRTILAAYVECFSRDFTIFVRNHLSDTVRASHRELWENGTLAWFHTSSEMEPRSMGTERQYLTFLEYCRTGKTVGYAEPWADAFGWHGLREPDPRWCSAPQWNYWRLLCDLHCGVSFVAVFGADLRIALDGKHPLPWSRVVDERQYPHYSGEFDEAFRFAARYAGYAAFPAESPGAWIAFRHSTINLSNDRPLEALTGDYTFHLRRLNAPGSFEREVGPEDQRYGAWALKLPPGEELRLAADDAFIRSLVDGKAIVSVIYLDRGNGTLELSLGPELHRQKLAAAEKWKTAKFSVDCQGSEPAVVKVRCTGAPVYLHMVAVERPET